MRDTERETEADPASRTSLSRSAIDTSSRPVWLARGLQPGNYPGDY